MTQYSQHPEVQVAPELQAMVERVTSGIERVIVLTSTAGDPLAAIVPLSSLRLLDEIDTREEGASADADDRSNIHLR